MTHPFFLVFPTSLPFKCEIIKFFGAVFVLVTPTKHVPSLVLKMMISKNHSQKPQTWEAFMGEIVSTIWNPITKDPVSISVAAENNRLHVKLDHPLATYPTRFVKWLETTASSHQILSC